MICLHHVDNVNTKEYIPCCGRALWTHHYSHIDNVLALHINRRVKVGVILCMCVLSVRVDNLSSSEHRGTACLPLRSKLAGVLRWVALYMESCLIR